jgi:hypothetical protein
MLGPHPARINIGSRASIGPLGDGAIRAYVVAPSRLTGSHLVVASRSARVPNRRPVRGQGSPSRVDQTFLDRPPIRRLPVGRWGYPDGMTIPPFPLPTPGDPDEPGPGLTPEEHDDVKDDEADSESAWPPSEPPERTEPTDADS